MGEVVLEVVVVVVVQLTCIGATRGVQLTDSSSVRRSSSMRDWASAYVSAALLRMMLLVKVLLTTCGTAAVQ